MRTRWKKPTAVISNVGNIFGRIHVFDALVLVVILLSFLLLGKQVLKHDTWLTIEIKVTPEQWWTDPFPPPNWYAQSIQIGDKEVDWNGKTIAEIVDTRVYDTGYDRSVAYIVVKINTESDKKTKRYKYKNQAVDIGGSIELNLSRSLIRGLIVYIEGVTDQRKKVQKVVTLKLYNRYPWHADAIYIGDTMKQGDKVIAEVIAKKVDNAEQTSLSLSPTSSLLPIGNLFVNTTNLLRRDITVKVKMQLIQDNDKLLFRDDQRVKIGNDLWIALSNINLTYATVVGIE